MRQQKVVMVGPSLDDLGGISRVVKTWYDHGFFDHHDVIYISTTSPDPRRNPLALFRALVSYLACLVRYDSFVYIHTSSHNGFYRKALFMVTGGLLRARMLLHVHPTHFRDFVEQSAGLKKTLILSILERVAAFAVLTESMAAYLQDRYPQKPVYVVPNVISVREYRQPGPVQRRENHLLYLGWYVKSKGVYDLVDAVEILVRRGEDVRIDLYGTKDVEKLREYVASRDLQSSIGVNGWIGPLEKVQALYSHSALVLPSYSEGMPNVILEAMATKTPIVSTPVGGLAEVLVDGENSVVVKPGDPVDLSEKISMVLKDEELRIRISEKAYGDVTRLFDTEVVRSKFLNIISELARPSRRVS